MAFMDGARPTFPSIADQRAASAGRVSARGGNMNRTRPTFPSIGEQRARNIVSGQRDARGYNNGYMRGEARPAFGSIADQRAASAGRVSARGGNMSGARPTFPSIADQRAASAGNYARRGVNLRGGVPVSVRPRGAPAGGGGTVRAAQQLNEDVVKKLGKKSKMLSNKGLMIGAGAAVIAGLAMNRRGDGTSSGRAGMTKY